MCPKILASAWLVLVACGPLFAQEAERAVLPGERDVAKRLADPALRHDALLDIAVTANYLYRSGQGAAGVEEMEADAAWLERLESRYGLRVLRSPVLDPSAWLVHLELTSRNLPPQPLVEPSGPSLETYLEQVFDRSDPRLASVLLPELLWLLEPRAVEVWQDLAGLLENDEALAQELNGVLTDMFSDWVSDVQAPQPVAPEVLARRLLEALDRMVHTAVAEGPPDPELLHLTRYEVVMAVPELEGLPEKRAIDYFRLATLLDGLHEGHYFSFAEGLLPLASDLIEAPSDQDFSLMRKWLIQHLPAISETYSRQFADVDPRLNSTLAAVYDVVSNLDRSSGDEADRQSLRQELADAVAQLALLIPDLGYYFNLPVRDTIAGGTDACTGMMARTEEDGTPSMTRELFDDCQKSLVELAEGEARSAALSGDPDGPFGEDYLGRELNVTSGQRINYGIGYLHARYRTGCPKPARPLPNPLEWSALATLLTWFAEQAPVYFQTPDIEARLQQMRA
ncbi:MAG: hypothetical protein KJO85_08520, partial [Gammaproteobacteria bacterium]|nr:hypothetical protein [Gammaproteobacteria bacterium]